jgi:transcriptional regulator with XRE-family HTH domain
MNNKLKSLIVLKYGTQGDFAENVKVMESTVSRVVRGRRSLSVAEQHRWAERLGCAVEDIFPVQGEKQEER